MAKAPVRHSLCSVARVNRAKLIHNRLKLKTLCRKFFNLAHYFPYDVKLRLLVHSQSFLANQKARNAIVGAENLLK